MRYKKIRLLFNIIMLSGVFFIVGFSLFKIIFGNKAYVKETKYEGFHTINIHWEKNNYIVPTNNISLPENANMVVGDYYYIQQSLLTKKSLEKCYFGFLKLQSIKKDHYVFFSPKILNKSNLYTFSLFNSNKLMVAPLTKNQYSNENHTFNCQNWIQLNNYNNKNHENKNKISKEFLRVSLNHCFIIPSKKYLIIESMASEYLQLEYNEIRNQVKLCAKKIGDADIYFQPTDGSAPFYTHASATFPKKITKHLPTKKQVNIMRQKENKSFLVQKNLPGWQ